MIATTVPSRYLQVFEPGLSQPSSRALWTQLESFGWRDAAVFGLHSVFAMITWPCQVLVFSETLPKRADNDNITRIREAELLLPTDAVANVLVMVGCLIVASLQSAFHRTSSTLTRTYSVVLLGIACQLLAYLLMHDGLLSRLRKTEACVVANFSVLALSLYVTVIILVGGLHNLSMSTLFSPGFLAATVKDLHVSSWFDLLKTLRAGGFDATHVTRVNVALCGLLLNLNVLAAVWKFREFRRTTDDYLELSERSVEVGDFERAAMWCSKVPSDERNQKWHGTMSAVFLYRKNLLAAFNHAQAVVVANSDCPGKDDAWMALMSLASGSALPKPIILDVLRHWCNSDCSRAGSGVQVRGWGVAEFFPKCTTPPIH